MELRMQMDLVPFTVPDEVEIKLPVKERQEGYVGHPSLLLSDLPAEMLVALCDQFRRDVFDRAKKTDPATTTKGQIERAP